MTKAQGKAGLKCCCVSCITKLDGWSKGYALESCAKIHITGEKAASVSGKHFIEQCDFILHYFLTVQSLICSTKPSNSLNRKLFILKILPQAHVGVEVGPLDVFSSNLPCSGRATQSQSPRTVPIQLLNISMDGDSTTPLGSLCQCLVIPTVKKIFPDVQRNLLCFSLSHCLLSCCWAPLRRAWLHLVCTLLSDIYGHSAPSSPGWKFPALSAFPHMRDVPVP